MHLLIKSLIVSSCIVLVLASIGIGTGIGVFFKLHQVEIDNAKRDFSSAMSFEMNSIESTVKATVRSVHTIRSVFNITNRDIHPYTMFLPMMESSQSNIVGTYSLGWISRVDGIDRYNVVNRSRSYGREYSSFDITVRNSTGHIVPAPLTPVYYILHYVYPLIPNIGAIGFDLLTEPARRDAIEKSLSSRADTATRRIFLPHAKYQQPGTLYLSPLVDDGGHIHGFGVGVFIIGDIFMTRSSSIDKQAVVSVFDTNTDNISTNTFLWSNTGEYGPSFGDDRHIRSIKSKLSSSKFSYKHRLTVGDRIWTVILTPKEGYMRRYRTGGKWIALICLVFGFLSMSIVVYALNAFLYMKWRSIQHMHEMEMTYIREHAEKTARLLNRISRMDNARKQIFNTIPDIVCVTDNTGRIIYANTAFYTVMGVKDQHVRDGINIGRFFIEKDVSFFIDTLDQFQETIIRPSLGKDIPVTYNSFSIDISPRSFAGGDIGDEDTYTEDNVYVVIARDLRDNKALLSELQANKAKLQYVLSESEFDKRWKNDDNGSFKKSLLSVCKKMKCEESMLFLQDVDRYKIIPKFSDRVDECEYMISTYFSDEGERQVNVIHAIKMDIINRLDRDIGDPMLFDTAYTAIRISIATEIFPILKKEESNNIEYL